MSDSDLVKLYSGRILELAADIPHLGRLSAPEGTAKKRSPLCGSTITVDLTLDGDRIARFGQDVKACALGQASASITARAILGRTREEVAQARAELDAMLKRGGPVPAAPFDGLEVLLPARDYANRHASILLSLDATLAAMDEALRARAAG
ncbi:MAG: iron-sulfur cluster assembly scaffold protein [Rhodobacteraceae bacterium]|nr:iron-sulfur cluster assembly scaffold protein [Paracoccaceae bacterium]